MSLSMLIECKQHLVKASMCDLLSQAVRSYPLLDTAVDWIYISLHNARCTGFIYAHIQAVEIL